LERAAKTTKTYRIGKYSMESIQIKTVDPISQELLKSAYQRGLKLSWDRFEKAQPQDGFLRTGLSCPYGCLQGPCRIDPFGRGPERGLCGLDRDGMVAALLLRLALNGALEAMPEERSGSEPSWAPSLKEAVSHAVKILGGDRISFGEIQKAVALLNRPMESTESMITQVLRLALLTIGWLSKRPASRGRKKSLSLRVGYGFLAQKEVNIGISGQPSPQFLEALLGEVDKNLPGTGQVLSLGEFISLKSSYLPCVCTSGEAELVLSSGKINFLIAGPGTDPSMIELCHTLNIPAVSSMDPGSVRELVQEDKGKRAAIQPSFNLQSGLMEEVEVVEDSSILEEYFKKAAPKKLAFLGGADHPYHSLGWLPTEIGSALQGRGFAVTAWGDCGLWMVKKGLSSPKNKRPVQILDGLRGPVPALKVLAASGRLKDVKGICYTGVKSCQDLATALGVAGLGFRVATAVPLPLWGSEKVRNLLQDKLAAMGGSLTHFDHPAQAEEILDWFIK
jgi:hypothetical protein